MSDQAYTVHEHLPWRLNYDPETERLCLAQVTGSADGTKDAFPRHSRCGDWQEVWLDRNQIPGLISALRRHHREESRKASAK